MCYSAEDVESVLEMHSVKDVNVKPHRTSPESAGLVISAIQLHDEVTTMEPNIFFHESQNLAATCAAASCTLHINLS